MPRNSNKKKSKILGMPYGTACSKLRKMIMFQLVKELGKDKCFRCSKLIESIEEFSIEHKDAWEDINETLFWDLNNIAFSHLRCNTLDAKRPHKKVGPPGTAWCYICKSFKDERLFGKNSKRWNGLDSKCKPCFSIRRKTYASRNKNATVAE